MSVPKVGIVARRSEEGIRLRIVFVFFQKSPVEKGRAALRLPWQMKKIKKKIHWIGFSDSHRRRFSAFRNSSKSASSLARPKI